MFHYISSALRIHVSNEAHSRLVELGGFYFEERGQVQIKVRKQCFMFHNEVQSNSEMAYHLSVVVFCLLTEAGLGDYLLVGWLGRF